MSVRDRTGWEIGSSGAFQLQFSLVFEWRFILNAVIAGQATHYFAIRPGPPSHPKYSASSSIVRATRLLSERSYRLTTDIELP
jgi:hypothetical protein